MAASELELEVKTVINCLHPVFDRSGRLPFSIVFGLCRVSSDASSDKDPRPMVLPTKSSILDLPYALSKGLLTLWAHDREKDRRWEVDVSQLDFSGSSDETYLKLPSPVIREGSWKTNLVVYHYPIYPDSGFGRLFEEGKTYTIRNKTGGDLGFTSWKFLDDDQISIKPTEETEPAAPKPRLVAARADGRALFSAVPPVQMPPELGTKIELCKSEKEDESTHVEVRTLNLSAESVVAQTRGRQRFLVPQGPMQPEDGIRGRDARPRIIDSENPSPLPTFQVVDRVTKRIVREAVKPGICGLCRPHDPRPLLQTLVTLNPSEPLVRRIDLSKLLSKLPDGQYGLRMEPRGMWWCYGSVEGFAAEGEDRVPQRLWNLNIPPMMLHCADVMELQVENGVGKH